ncbi:MAG: flippase-like domain-containing protein [archaeon]
MKRVLGFIFTLVIVGLLIWVLKDINFYEVYLLIAQANLFWFILAFLASVGTFVVWNFRWMYMLKPIIKPEFGFFLNVLLAGSFFNTLTPGAGIGGEPFRAYFLSEKYKKSKTKVLGYILGDSFFRLATLFVFVFFSVLFVLVYVQISDTLKYVLEGILVFVILLAILFTFFMLKRLSFNFGAFFRKLHWFRFIKKRFKTSEDFVKFTSKKIKSFEGIFRKVVKNKKNMLVGFSLSFIFWIFNFLTAYFLFLSFGFKVNFLSVIIVFTLGNIIGSLSPIPGGIGVVESSMTLLYSAMGVVPSLALLVAFMQRIIYYFFSLFLGGGSLIRLRKITNGGKFSLF